MLPNTEPLRGSKVTPVSEKGQGKGRLKKGHGSWAVGFEFEIILQCGCQYDSYVTFQLEVLTGYFWINFDCVFYFCAKCSICLKEMNFSAEWIHDCSRWIIYYQPTELQDSFIHKSTKKCLVAFLYWKSELLPILPRMTCSQNVLWTSRGGYAVKPSPAGFWRWGGYAVKSSPAGLQHVPSGFQWFFMIF